MNWKRSKCATDVSLQFIAADLLILRGIVSSQRGPRIARSTCCRCFSNAVLTFVRSAPLRLPAHGQKVKCRSAPRKKRPLPRTPPRARRQTKPPPPPRERLGTQSPRRTWPIILSARPFTRSKPLKPPARLPATNAHGSSSNFPTRCVSWLFQHWKNVWQSARRIGELRLLHRASQPNCDRAASFTPCHPPPNHSF